MKTEHFDIKARQCLSKSDLAAIRELASICNEHEGLKGRLKYYFRYFFEGRGSAVVPRKSFSGSYISTIPKLKLNWDMLCERQADVTDDFLCFEESGQLVGYLALYGFGGSEIEISGMVHPLYRRSGVFSRLLAGASDECRRRGIKSLLFICDRNSSSGVAFVKAHDTVFDHSENKMEMPGSAEPVELHSPIILRKTGVEDFDLLAKLNAICFNMSEEDTRSFFIKNNILTSDQLFISVLDGIDIGMLRLTKENDDILIYGFGIKPEYRGKGYGRITLSRAVNIALEQKPKRVALEVDCVNDTALSLYKSCGFKTTATYDYYRLPL